MQQRPRKPIAIVRSKAAGEKDRLFIRYGSSDSLKQILVRGDDRF